MYSGQPDAAAPGGKASSGANFADTSAVGVQDRGREVLTPVLYRGSLKTSVETDGQADAVHAHVDEAEQNGFKSILRLSACSFAAKSVPVGPSTSLCDVGKEVRSARESGRVGVLMFQESEKGIKSSGVAKRKD